QQRPSQRVAAAAPSTDAAGTGCGVRSVWPIRRAWRLQPRGSVRTGRDVAGSPQESRAGGSAFPRERSGMGAMSITRSYEGVRHVVVDDLGDGSITVMPGARPDVVEASIEGADDAYLEQIQIRHDR